MNEAEQAAGLRAELAGLVTEEANPELADLDGMSTAGLVRTMNLEDQKVPAAITAKLPEIAQIIDQVAARMARGGRLIYVGAGTPGRIGVLDASECPPTFGTDPGQVVGILAGGEPALTKALENVEDDVDAGRADLARLELTAADSVIGISASGRTPYVLAAVTEATAAGAFTVGFACNRSSALGSAAGSALELDLGPEFLTGSTRLKAGTAQKLVLNMISTIVMVRLGKTYRNLMVDLSAGNAKLRARSERTVMQATGADLTAAEAALSAAQGSVKAAILIILTGLPTASAFELLKNHDGKLQAALQER